MKRFSLSLNCLRVFIFLIIGQGVLFGAGNQSFYRDETVRTGDQGPAIFILDGDGYKFAHGNEYAGVCGCTGPVSLEDLGDGNWGFVDFSFGAGFYDFQMYTAAKEPRTLQLRSDLHIYGDLKVPGTFAIDSSYTDTATIFFHKDGAISLDSNYGLSFDAGGYTLDFMGHRLSCTGDNVFIMHSSDIDVTIKNATFETSSDRWINVYDLVADNVDLYFENIIFNSDPYVDNWILPDHDIYFNGLDNQFNAGLKLWDNVTLGSKYPFSGELNLNSKILTLKSDILFEKNASFSGAGTIKTNGTNRTLRFRGAQAPSGAITIDGTSTVIIDGGGYEFDFINGLIVNSGSTLILRNVKLQNYTGNVTGNVTFGPDVLLIS